MNDQPHIQTAVASWLEATTATASSLSTIPVPINPETTYSSVQHVVAERHEELLAQRKLAEANRQGRITELTQGLSSQEVADLSAYKNGAAPAISTRAPVGATASPYDIGVQLNACNQRAMGLLAAMPGLVREGWLALAVAVVLVAIAALGACQPLMMAALGDDKAPGDLTAIVWAVVVATALALTAGAINVLFARPTVARLAPWHMALGATAIAVLALRYMAAAMQADFLLMDDMPAWVARAVRLTAALGFGVALLCVELGAGKALALFWIRFQTRTDLPRLQEIVHDIGQWNQLRAELAASTSMTAKAMTTGELVKTGVLLVVQVIDRALDSHREKLRQIAVHTTQAWAGTPLEHINADWLQTQVTLCEEGRNDLLRLAGLGPCPAAAPPPASPPPMPPAPPAAPANPGKTAA